jgi:gallate dioxygenase
MAVQLAGAEKLEGTYPFSIEVAVRAFRINEYLHKLVEPAHREAFVRDPEASFEAAGLSDEERDMLRRTSVRVKHRPSGR